MLHLLIISPQLWINIQSVHESPFRKYRVPLDQLLAFKLDPADAFLSQLLYFQAGRYIESSSVIVFLGGSIILFYLIYKKTRKGEKWISPHLTFFSFFILTILLSTSFYRFLALIPPFDILRWPFKFLMIVPFFYVATFSFIGRGKKDSEGFRFSLILLFCSALQMIVLLNSQNQNSFSKLRVQNIESLKIQWPYREGRVLPVASDDKYVMDPQLLAYNFGTSNNIPTLAGYDQLIAVKNFKIALELQVPGALEVERVEQNLNHLQTWGVRYLTGSPLDPKIQAIDKLKELRLIYHNEKILVWEYPGALPLLSQESKPKEAIRYITTPQSISFTPSPEPADYTLRFAHLDQLHYRCITDHQKGPWKPLLKNKDQTLKISIQERAETIEVRYLPDSFQIYLFTISSILMCFLIFIRLKPI